ncbi:hypothetical protein M0R36_10150 [bacterium]|jgi:hypothetical protein|nr:hypothetical protein [bacterium]
MKLIQSQEKSNKFGEFIFSDGYKWKFAIKNLTMRNSCDEIIDFIKGSTLLVSEYEPFIRSLIEYYVAEDWDNFFEKLKDVSFISKKRFEMMDIDVSNYCNPTKKTGKSLYIDEKMMKMLLETIISLKLISPFIFDKNNFTEYLYKKFMFVVTGELYNAGFVDILYRLIRQLSFKFSLSDKMLWNLVSIKYGYQNIGYSLMMFNSFMHQFLVTYDFGVKKNPMTFIVSVINEKFTWLIRTNINSTIISDNNENYFEQYLMALDVDKLIMNESMFNNHILFGLKYLFDKESVDNLIQRSADVTVSPIMYTIGNLITSKITGISTSFLNERKTHYIVLNNLFISQLISKLYPEDPFFQKLSLLLRVVKTRKNSVSKNIRKKTIKKYYTAIMEKDVNFYGIKDKSIVINLLNYIIEDLRMPYVYDIVKGNVVTITDDWVEIIIDTMIKLFDDKNEEFEKIRKFFLTMVTMERNME